MKNKITFLLIFFAAQYAVVVHSAEPSAASKQAPLPNQPPEMSLQTLRAKLGQVRAVLSEIRDLLKQEDKILAGTREQKEQAKKSEASLAEHNRAADIIKQEIQKLQDQVKEAEKELAAQTKQTEHYSRVQDEYAKAQKERADYEAKAQQAENKLAAAQKSLTELKGKITETMKQVDDAKKRSLDLENAAAVLKTERTRRAEALTRAEKAVAMAEKAEKERLLLASRLVEIGQKLPPRPQNSPEQTDIQGEIEKEKKAIQETEEKIKKDEKACAEAENTIAALKKQLKTLRETARGGKENDPKPRQARLDNLRKQRAEAEDQMKKTEDKLKAGEESTAVLSNMIAIAERQQGKDKETVNTIGMLANELEKEIALMNELNARIDKQNGSLKALEDEKTRLNQCLILVKEKLGREEQRISKLDETRLQVAEQKKNRADMEAKLQKTTRDQDALEKEKEQLNRALIEAGKLILKNENDFQKAGQVADELQKEKELARKSADLLREKERGVKQLADDKAELQNKLNEAEAKLAQQKERTGDIEEKRRVLDEEKKAKLASEKKSRELAQAEKEHKEQIKELKSKTRAAIVKSESLSSQAEKELIISQARTESPQNSTASGPEAKETQGAANTVESSGKDVLSVEQDILNKARSGGIQPSGQDAGTDQPQEKKAMKKTGSSRQNQLAQAEEHYELGIQKWDEDDLDGAIEEFKKTVRLNPDAIGAYYNISLVYFRQGRTEEACSYAYKAGQYYIKVNNLIQASRMAVLMTKIDENSPLIRKLRNKIAAASQ